VAEYYNNRTHFDWAFNIQYHVAGLIITVLGCGISPQIGRSLTERTWRRFTITVGATLTILVVAAVVSDAGGLLGMVAQPQDSPNAHHYGYQDTLALLKSFFCRVSSVVL
jgi:hypothetical protein